MQSEQMPLEKKATVELAWHRVAKPSICKHTVSAKHIKVKCNKTSRSAQEAFKQNERRGKRGQAGILKRKSRMGQTQRQWLMEWSLTAGRTIC